MSQYKIHNPKDIVISEPAVAYSADRFKSISAILHQQSQDPELHDDLDLIKIVRDGLTKEVMWRITKYLGISQEMICDILHVSPRTFQRKKMQDHLNISVSGQLVELAELISKGIDVFGSIERFQSWLISPLIVLNGQKPVDFLDTSFGTQYLLKVLGRLEYGVYS